MTSLTIGDRRIEREGYERPYLIAEAGVNHEGSLDTAKRMVEQAAEAGADAIKFQTYKADKLASKNSPAYWDTEQEPAENQYELFRQHDDFWRKEYEILADHAGDHGIHFLSTPFDPSAVDLLEPLVPAYKVASADITNHPLLEHIASTGKPMLMSTGASTLAEIYEALRVVREAGDPPVALLHCVLNYPTPDDQAHVGMIEDMVQRFPEHVIGYSDHTHPDADPNPLLLAWMLGARVIEKHYTHDKSLEGNDHYHAYDQADLAEAVKTFESARTMLGSRQKDYLPSEEDSRENARRSIVAARDIAEGKRITDSDVAIKRPGTGIPPARLQEVLGGTAVRDLEADEVLTLNAVKFEDGDAC